MKFIPINATTYLNIDNLEEIHFLAKKNAGGDHTWYGCFVYKDGLRKELHIGIYEEMAKLEKSILSLEK